MSASSWTYQPERFFLLAKPRDMAEGYSTQALSSSHADLITSLSFSSSSPSLLASTSLDGWIRVHARASPPSGSAVTNGKGRAVANGKSNGGNAELDEDEQEEADEWVEVGACKANDGPVWKACWGPREYGTSLLASIAGSVVNVWGELLSFAPHLWMY